MGLSGKLLFAILLGLAGNAIVWTCLLAGDGPVPRGRGPSLAERAEVVAMIVDWRTWGVPLPVTNPGDLPLPPRSLDDGESLVIQIPDGVNLRGSSRVELRTDSAAMTGLFSRMPDWHVRFNDERCGRGDSVVFVSSATGPTHHLIELTFTKRLGRWTGRVTNVAVGCG